MPGAELQLLVPLGNLHSFRCVVDLVSFVEDQTQVFACILLSMLMVDDTAVLVSSAPWNMSGEAGDILR